jgi:hypothetical protein
MFGISWRPSQPTKVSFNPKNIGFNDLITAGTMFGTGGLSGIGNIGKWSTGNLARNFTGANTLSNLTGKAGLLQGLTAKKGAKAPASDGTVGDYNAQLSELINHMNALGHDQLDFAQANEPARQSAISGAVRSLQPSSVYDSIARSRNQAIGNAYTQADQGNAALQSQGYSAQPGVLLDALNQANSGANQNMYNQLAPTAQAARYQQLAQILDPQNTSPMTSQVLQALLSGQGLNNQNAQLQAQLKANRPASAFETLLSAIGPLAGQYINAQQNKPKSVLKTDKYGFTY